MTKGGKWQRGENEKGGKMTKGENDRGYYGILEIKNLYKIKIDFRRLIIVQFWKQ